LIKRKQKLKFKNKYKTETEIKTEKYFKTEITLTDSHLINNKRATICLCMRMNKHSILIMHLIAVTSIGNKTKHTYIVQNNKATF